MVWLRIGVLSFGGPAGQIAMMHKMVVEERRWIDEKRFLHALNYCMLLPGPEAQQLATYLGWLLHGIKGGMIAGVLFILPGLVAITALSSAYALYLDTAWLAAIFFGLKAAVLAIVVQALLRIASRMLRADAAFVIAGLAFVSVYALQVPFPLIIIAAAFAGGLFLKGDRGAEDSPVPQRSRGWLATMAPLFFILAWLAPLAAMIVFAAPETMPAVFAFFARVALVAFGGAYAVLAYVAQQAVTHFHWLTPAQMMDGLALAETTPGPLVLVLCFVGFFALYNHPLLAAPVLSGVLGALLTAWAIFMPSFVFIFAGAPFVETLRRKKSLAAALAGIGASIVGVMANLALWFAVHVLFTEVRAIALPWSRGVAFSLPVWSSLDPLAFGLSLAAMIAVMRFKLSLMPLLFAAAVAGLALLPFL
ncbi:chromate efflux transporter [Martelella alba]|uniref:Chromate efflux transporter n=2 Tax=Martelella alba TaxID=2590451 RepID=A0A506U9Q1_9HYPH|nr:chromate efflux transporter [Martelella alba]